MRDSDTAMISGLCVDGHFSCGCVAHPSVPITTTITNLTNREREVLGLLGTGLPNRRIARTLSISERTVKAHVHSIQDKLGVESRLQAALLAVFRHQDICPHNN
jgi:DNA-binding NarL/FixJ family response regulator